MSLSTRVLLGLGLGILAGLFFGESVAFLEGVGSAFVVLLQMTVLPFVTVALIRSLGGLRKEDAVALARSAGAFLLLVWALTLVVVGALPLAFPDWEAASFFSTSLVETAPPFDPVALYLPANPFRALADGVVPAVVVFSVAVGLALMAIERKETLLDVLRATEDALQRVAAFVVSLAPYGVFAIAGHAAGTMLGDELLGLQVYAVAYVVAALALSLWILPMLVVAVTPFSYGEVVGHARAALLTAFATGSVFVVLPILAERSRELLESREETRDKRGLVEVIVPIAFTLSSAGKLLSLGFILFAGWLSGFPLSPGQMPQFIATGVFSFFASTAVAIPFLLDLFRIPADAFQLFLVADNIVGNRFGSMLASVHILSITLLGACGTAGVLALRPVRLARWAGVGVLLIVAGLGGTRLFFESIEHPYQGYRTFIERERLLPDADARELASPAGLPDSATPVLAGIRERGVIRVGFGADALPYVFHNETGELVGLDVEMAHALARDLGVRLEFVPIAWPRMAEHLDRGAVDVVMSGVAITPQRLEAMSFTDPYMEVSLAFVVPDHLRDDFADPEIVRSLEAVRIGVPRLGYYGDMLSRYLPQAEVVALDSPRSFFADPGEIDALLLSAETGSAWTLIYPQFAVAVPGSGTVKVPLGYALRRGEPDMVEFLNRWILLKQRDRTVSELFHYWIEGVDPPGAAKRRWSILHDVILGD